jgi:hypothetical protein
MANEKNETVVAKDAAKNENPLGKTVVPEGTKIPDAKKVKAAKKGAKGEKKEKGITFVSLLDVILNKGGKWEDMIKAGNAAKDKLEKAHPETPVEFNGKAKLMSLIKYRVEVQGKKDYLGGKKVTKDGIF